MNTPIGGNEGERIYRAIFGRKIPLSVREHFEILSKRIENRYSEKEVGRYIESIGKTCDLEALEVASRHAGKVPILSEKFKIMVYLAETCPENYHVFVNEQPGLIRACMLLILSVLRSGYKFAKGMFILTIHKI